MVSPPLEANLVVSPSSLSLLLRTSPKYLVPFFRPFEGFLAERGVRLEEAHDRAWVERLIEALTAPEANLPSALAQALLDVSELAGNEGLVNALDAPHVRQLDLFRGRSQLLSEDLAFHLSVAHGAAFRATRALVATGGGEARRFAEYLPRRRSRVGRNASNLLNI